MKAIRTRSLRASNLRGVGVAADCDELRIRVEHDFDISDEENHRAAAHALCNRLGWHGALVGPGVYRGDRFWIVQDGPHG